MDPVKAAQINMQHTDTISDVIDCLTGLVDIMYIVLANWHVKNASVVHCHLRRHQNQQNVNKTPQTHSRPRSVAHAWEPFQEYWRTCQVTHLLQLSSLQVILAARLPPRSASVCWGTLWQPITALMVCCCTRCRILPSSCSTGDIKPISSLLNMQETL